MLAEVLIEYKIKSLDKSFRYIVPDSLKDKLKKGMKVKVPFGNSNKTINGFIINIIDKNSNENLKEIESIENEELILNDELLKCGLYLKNTYICTLISAYQTMLPSSLKIKNNKINYKKYDSYIKLCIENKEATNYLNIVRTKGQREIIEYLIKNKKALKNMFNQSSVKTLINKNIIEIIKEEKYRINKEDSKKDNNIILNNDQLNAYNKVISSFNKNEIFLLHGVTGSGKTEVYMRLIQYAINQGKSAIMLVPEITLSMQIINIFYEGFGDKVAILHSALSDGEKYDEYLKIYREDAKIIVGTRSAIFAPVKNLGIIIIDEEHSDSYKQDNTPRYNAIDVAKFRGKYNNIPIILGSATPSYESYARALKNVYTLINMPNRIDNAKMPIIKVVDMAKERKEKILSSYLKDKIQDRLNKNEQIILFLNRRGYATLISCDNCGYTYKCPYCDITLTYHKSSNMLRCHYCGYSLFKKDKCPKCNDGKIKALGIGTEKLEQEIKDTFKDAKIIRMDADTTTRKGSHEQIIKDFKDEKYNILLGTQMISKGLDFKKVSLVGVINTDAILNIPNYKAGERAYALLSQVAGRAGRSGLSSEVIIQTYKRDNFTIMMVERGTYKKNFKYEMAIRKKLKYSPYYYLISIKICSKIYEKASIEATKVYNYLKNNINKEDYILGPSTSNIFKVNGIYRFQLLIKYKYDDKIYNTLKELDNFYIFNKDVYLEIDVNPYNI